MDHVAAQQCLAAFYDAELDSAQSKEVASHLDSCQECSRTLKDWGKLGKTFFRPAAAPSRTQTELFVKAVMDKIEEEEASVWVPLRWLVPALGFAAASLFLAIAPLQRETDDVADSILAVGPVAGPEDVLAPIVEDP